MTPTPILLYHSVATTCSERYRPWCVHPDAFAEQLDVVRDLGYTAMGVSDFVDARAAGTLPDKPCLITFDDGRADFVEGAAPALEARKMPATLYMVSGHIGGSSSWLPMHEERDQPLLGWSDLRSLSNAGVEIGAHSETHPELDVTGSRRLHTEVSVSRARLSDGLGSTVRSFAYPHGYHSPRVVRSVRDAGFDSAVAVKDRWSHDAEDRFSLARMFVWSSTTAEDLYATLTTPPTRRPNDAVAQRLMRRGWRYARWLRGRLAPSA